MWQGTYVEQKQQRKQKIEGNMAVRGYQKAGQSEAIDYAYIETEIYENEVIREMKSKANTRHT